MSTSLGVPGEQSDGKSVSMKGVVPAVDASKILLRLAGKSPTKPEQNEANEGKSKNKDQRQNSDNVGETKDNEKDATSDDSKSEFDIKNIVIQESCSEELDETTLAAFKELFNKLDQSNTGTVTAENMYEELQRVDSEITFSEVENVLKKVDKDGNGSINFEEFLYHMANTIGDQFGEESGETEDEEQRNKRSRRKRLFYSAITHFSIKQALLEALADMEKAFRKQPHVIGHYTAGARLIGLTTRQLEQRMKRMQESAVKLQADSPYAKPLNFVHLGRKGSKNVVQRTKIKTAHVKDKSESSQDLQQREKAESEDHFTKELQDAILMFSKTRGSIVPEDADIIMKLRERIGSVTARMQDGTQESNPRGLSKMPSLNTPRTARTEEMQYPKRPKARSAPVKKPGEKEKRKNLMKGLGWTTARIQYIDVPLPSLKMKLTSEKPTFNDLHRIRAKVKQAIDAYYHNLRQAEVRNAWEHWDRLYADVIKQKKLLSNFRRVYALYSPHREEEAFVVCPWKPGPFRILRHIQKPPLFSIPKSPGVAITGSPRHRSAKAVLQLKNVSYQQPFALGRQCSSVAESYTDSF